MGPTNSVIYGTLTDTLQAIRCCASYILLNRLGLGINFIQRIPPRSYNDTQFVAVTLFVVTPGSTRIFGLLKRASPIFALKLL